MAPKKNKSTPDPKPKPSNATSSAKGKHWCFTLNNPVLSPQQFYDKLVNDHKIEYFVFGIENATSTNTRHYQGYVKFICDMRFNSVRDILPGAHLEGKSRSSTVKQASDYCKKEGVFFEFGKLPEEMAPIDRQQKWAVARKAALAGSFALIDDQIFISHYSSIQRIFKDAMPAAVNLTSPCGLWIWGESGCGKTQLTRQRWPNLYPKPMNKWWDGYNNESTVVLDDVDKVNGTWLGYFLKIWADSVSFICENKGGARSIRPSMFVVTSQYAIDDIWSDQETTSALARRFFLIDWKTIIKWSGIGITSDNRVAAEIAAVGRYLDSLSPRWASESSCPLPAEATPTKPLELQDTPPDSMYLVPPALVATGLPTAELADLDDSFLQFFDSD